MDDVRIVGVKLKHIKEMPEHLGHFGFRQKLIARCKELGRNIIICREDYTSKTCGNCGFINRELGANKVYDCPQCKKIFDRDINGARNILIRVLTKYHVSTNKLSLTVGDLGSDTPVKLGIVPLAIGSEGVIPEDK